jgi:hypothetical protein
LLTYARIDPALLDQVQAHQLFENVTEHYLSLAGHRFDHVDQLASVPTPVRVVWCLWMFLADVGGNGVRDYLWNHCHSWSELREVHQALVTVGADDLRVLLESCISLSLGRDVTDFLGQGAVKEWAAQFPPIISFDLDEINSRSIDLAYPTASEIVASYIRKHRQEF